MGGPASPQHRPGTLDCTESATTRPSNSDLQQAVDPNYYISIDFRQTAGRVNHLSTTGFDKQRSDMFLYIHSLFCLIIFFVNVMESQRCREQQICLQYKKESSAICILLSVRTGLPFRPGAFRADQLSCTYHTTTRVHDATKHAPFGPRLPSTGRRGERGPVDRQREAGNSAQTAPVWSVFHCDVLVSKCPINYHFREGCRRPSSFH